MRSSRSDSPKPFLWIAAALVLLLAGGGAVWLLRGSGDGSGEPVAPTVARPDETPETPVTFPDAPPTQAARNIDIAELPPSRPRSAQAVAQIGGPTGDIEGVVVDKKGLPVAGVQITTYLGNPVLGGGFPMQHDAVDSTATSAADGVFKLKEVPVGTSYVVQGEHDEYGRSEITGIKVEKDRVTPGVKLVMIDGAVIRGMVNSAGGGPIVGARVELYFMLDMALLKPDDQKPWKVVFTDNQGRFAFTHVSSLNIRLRASADNYESQTRSFSNAFDTEPHDQDVTFELNSGQVLSGRSVDDNFAPVPHVRLEATSLTKDFQSTSIAFSDPNGYFLLEGLGTNAYQVHATCEGYSDTTVPRVDVTAGTLQVIMSKRGGVEGWVVNTAGKAVPHFSLYLMRARTGGEASYMNDGRSFDDPAGHFLFGNLDPGDYQLEARADDYADAQSAPFTIARNDPAPPQIKIAMSRGGSVKGVVKAPDGTPVAGAIVSLNANNFMDSSIAKIFAAIAPSDERERKVRSGTGGTFSFDHVPPGIYQLAAEHVDFAQRAINDVSIVDDDQGGNQPLEIRLAPGAGISGRALDNNSAALPFCKVQISQKDNGFMDVVNTDTDGYFAFKNLKEGQYQITINPDKVNGEAVHPFLRLVYASKSSKDVYVSEGQSVDGILIQLKTN